MQYICSDYQSLYDLVKNNNLQFSSQIPGQLKCIICGNTLIDSCFSSCGCKFCFSCIKKYLKDGPITCPGKKVECSEVILSMDEVIRDPYSNMEVSLLTVLCPNKNCDYECQLRKLTEHMQVCPKACINCIYSTVGCLEMVYVEDLPEHLHTFSVDHSKLLICRVNDLEKEIQEKETTQEIGELKQIIQDLQSEIKLLKEEKNSAKSKEANDAGDVHDDNDRNEEIVSVHTLDEFNKAGQIDANIHMQAVRRLVEDKYLEMIKLKDEIMQSMNILRDEQGDMHNYIATMMNQIEDIRENIVNSEELESQHQTTLASSPQQLEDDVMQEPKPKRAYIEKVQSDSFTRQAALDRLVNIVAGSNDFTWHVSHIAAKCETLLYSQPFNSDGLDGYKMCLCFCMHSSGLWLIFKLMRSEKDDDLQWPLQRTVLIEIIDEQTSLAVLSRRVCRATASNRDWSDNRIKAYNKPVKTMNKFGDGFVGCMTYEQLISAPGAVRNDSIVVRCRVLPQ